MLTAADLTPAADWTLNRGAVPFRHGSKLDAHFAEAPMRQFRSSEMLFADGDAKQHAYKIESGAVLIYKILRDGVRQIVNLAFPGDYVGLEAGDTHTYEAQALSLTRIRTLATGTLWRRAAEDPALARDIVETVSRDFAETRHHLLTIGRLSATGRVATFLLTLVNRNARRKLDPNSLLLPVRRSDIADFLCLSVETVSRSLTELKAARAISLRGWRYIRVHDVDLLERLADGESVAGSTPKLFKVA